MMMQDIGYIITISIGKCLGDTLNVFQCDLNQIPDEDVDTDSLGNTNVFKSKLNSVKF